MTVNTVSYVSILWPLACERDAMNRLWIINISLISLTLLLTLKTHEKRTLIPYFKSEKSYKLNHFESAKSRVSSRDVPLLELWESMLTGRVAPLDKWLRNEYRTLALAHVFTPSGFHLSALLWPLLLVFRKKTQKLWILGIIGGALAFLPGQGALKRMTMIKIQQQFFGLKTGFVLALLLDIFWGSFQNSPLGFTYSFFFLGIIYSGARGLTLMVWFFCAQLIISFVQGTLLSPLLLFISPFINSILSLVLPFLFLFSWPLHGWQLEAGLSLLRIMQAIVSWCYSLVLKFPLLEVNMVLVFIIVFIFLRHGRLAVVTCLLLTADLNTEKTKIPTSGSYEWQAHGRVIKVVDSKIYREDGICKRELVKGIWFETCSPRRRSRNKKLKKLSYLFEEQRMSSLRGLRT